MKKNDHNSNYQSQNDYQHIVFRKYVMFQYFIVDIGPPTGHVVVYQYKLPV